MDFKNFRAPVIKLDAIDSTNNYLKKLIKNTVVENLTSVVAKSQFAGKGQRGAGWESEAGKNLTASIYLANPEIKEGNLFELNIVAGLAVHRTVSTLAKADIKLKWPNDIMAGGKKIGGILIENVIASRKPIHSVVGIGLNVNQMEFESPKAGSIKSELKLELEPEDLLADIISNLQYYLELQKTQPGLLWEKYHSVLFRKDLPSAFENRANERFMAIVSGVSTNGLLQLRLEDDSVQEYDIKEVKMLY